jgi:hypothetical protein
MHGTVYKTLQHITIGTLQRQIYVRGMPYGWLSAARRSTVCTFCVGFPQSVFYSTPSGSSRITTAGK